MINLAITTLIPFATVGSNTLELNVMQPNTQGPNPVIMHIHGGAWIHGSHTNIPTTYQSIVDTGITVISVEYRLGTEAVFPAAIHDIKGAIRFVRANSGLLNIDPTRIGIAGESAGAHLALLTGLTPGNAFFEGTTGGNLQYNSDVKLIIDYYGATDLLTLAQTNVHPLVNWYDNRSGLMQFMGINKYTGNQFQLDRLNLASPVNYITAQAPAIFIAHSEFDYMISCNQSYELINALRNNNAQCEFTIKKDSIHGWWIGSEIDKARLEFIKNNL